MLANSKNAIKARRDRRPRWRLGRVGAVGRVLGGTAGALLLLSSLAHAQELPGDAGPEPVAPVAPVVPVAPSVPASAAAPATAVAAAAREDPSAADKRISDLEARLAAVESTQRASEKDSGESIFKIYGFADVGVQRTWVSSHSLIAPFVISSNATNFVVGNLNLYLDAQPSKDWRFLGEVHFTSAPAGSFVVSDGGAPPGTVARLVTQQYGYEDPVQTDGSFVYGGLVSIERAHIDWTHFNAFKLRVGQFFTPFGIYNVDHGTPVLITAYTPFFIASRVFPTRQTGIMAYGSEFVGPWELGYSAYVSNGRTELAPVTFDDNRGFGARLTAANEGGGDLSMKFGLSGYTGKVADKVVDLSLGPTGLLAAVSHKTFAYREYIAGADASFDIGATRIRAEGAIARVIYDSGLRQTVAPIVTAPGASSPDAWTTSAYAVVAHRVSFLDAEPFVTGSFHRTPWGFADTNVQLGGGLNFYITAAVILRSQVQHAWLLSVAGTPDTKAIASEQDLTTVISRLIMSF